MATLPGPLALVVQLLVRWCLPCTVRYAGNMKIVLISSRNFSSIWINGSYNHRTNSIIDHDEFNRNCSNTDHIIAACDRIVPIFQHPPLEAKGASIASFNNSIIEAGQRLLHTTCDSKKWPAYLLPRLLLKVPFSKLK